MARNPLPVLVKCGRYVATLSRSDMDALRVAHNSVNLVGQTKYFSIIGTHAIGHDFFIDANHMPVSHVELIDQERQQWQTEGDFPRFGSGDIKSDRRMYLQQVIAQVFGK